MLQGLVTTAAALPLIAETCSSSPPSLLPIWCCCGRDLALQETCQNPLGYNQ